MENNNPKSGKIVQVIGAVVDAEFPKGGTPEIYDALEVTYKLADSETESKIQEALKILTKDKTTIVIAHRLSTILNSNNIYVIDAGKVVERGQHIELMKESELYKKFYEKQIQK